MDFKEDIFKLDEGKDFQLSDLPHTEVELHNIPHFEFENCAVIALGAKAVIVTFCARFIRGASR